jgi:hypothetical protein
MYCRCGNQVSDERAATGMTTCIVCGDKDARTEISQKQTRTGVPYNKGATMYLGDPNTAKQILLEGGNRKSAPVQFNIDTNKGTRTVVPRSALASGTTVSIKSRKVIGVCRVGEDRVYIYEDEPLPQGATMVALWILA